MGSATERLRKRLRLRFCAPFTSFNLSSYLKYLCAELWQGRPQFLPDARERACAAVHRCAATPADPGQEETGGGPAREEENPGGTGAHCIFLQYRFVHIDDALRPLYGDFADRITPPAEGRALLRSPSKERYREQ